MRCGLSLALPRPNPRMCITLIPVRPSILCRARVTADSLWGLMYALISFMDCSPLRRGHFLFGSGGEPSVECWDDEEGQGGRGHQTANDHRCQGALHLAPSAV